MHTRLTRRELLRAPGAGWLAMRPPAALPEGDFLAKCDGCAQCVSVCPQSILHLQDEVPRMDFSLGNGECIFCGECTTACPTGALSAAGARHWSWIADANANCLSTQGITCRACQDSCEPRAIRFQLMTGGRAIPLIDESCCTGCGACAGVCPAGAIQFTERSVQTAESTQ